MADFEYSVRLMSNADVPAVLEIWKQTGMDIAAHCVYTWMAVDPEAFYVAVTNSGEVIAACGAVHHGPDFAFLGLYCCLEKYRGRGIAKKVWDECMKHIGTRNAALNAVPDKLEMYRGRGGFPVLESGWTCIVNEAKHPVDHESLSNDVPEGIVIEHFRDALLPAMLEFDLTLGGYDRKSALELSCKEVGTKTLVAMKDGKCVGFGTIKTTCHNHVMVGPLYADEAAVAEVILRRLTVSLTQRNRFVVNTVSANIAATELMKKIGCPTTGECVRLYRKERIEFDINKVFAFWDIGFSPY